MTLRPDLLYSRISGRLAVGRPRKLGIFDLFHFARRGQAAFGFPGYPMCAFFSQGVPDVRTAWRNKERLPFLRFHDTSSYHHCSSMSGYSTTVHLDENIIKGSLKDFPLAEYAAKHWVDHARVKNVSSKVQDGMKRLFDPSKATFQSGSGYSIRSRRSQASIGTI